MSGFDDRDRLVRELRERSQAVGGHPLDLDSVKRSARRIQRRRRAAVGLAAAAVLAVAVPAGFAMSGTSTRSVGPAGHATASVTTSASPSPTPTPSPSVPASPAPTATPNDTGNTTGISLGVLGSGPAPTIGWLEGRTYHHDGTTTTLPGVYTDVSAYRGGWLAVDHSGQGARVVTIDNTGTVVSEQPGGDRIVASADGTRIAWFADGAIRSALPSGMSEAEGTEKITPGVYADVVGWADNHVVYTTSGGDTGSVYLTDMAGTNRIVPGLVTSRGSSDAAGLVGGLVSYDDKTGTSCWAVVKVTGERLWRTCDWALQSFSTDGSLVLGIPSEADGLGPTKVALLDARSGEVKAVFELPPNGFASGFGWEDDSHVLATVYDDGQWGVVRLAPDGSARRVLPSVTGTDTEAPYHLVGR